MAERKQCPFCFAYKQLRADGTFPEHRLTGGKICNGSARGYDDAKALKRRGAPMAREHENPSGRPDTVEPEDIF